MFILSVLPDAMLQPHELNAIAYTKPYRQLEVPPEPSPHRVEVPTNITLAKIRMLRVVATITLNLPDNTPSLIAIPLLLEAIHNGTVSFPILHNLPPEYYYVTQQAYDSLLRYAPSRIIVMIHDTPLPDTPIIYNPTTRRDVRFDIHLPYPTYQYLQTIGQAIITKSFSGDPANIALDWIGVTKCLSPTST